MKKSALFTIMFTIACTTAAPSESATLLPAAATKLPGDSIYQLDLPLVDQDGRRLQLAERRGRPQLISMFYTSCQYVCPLIIDTLQKTEHALPVAEQARLQVLLVSFDPDTDTPPVLKKIAIERHVQTPRWLLAQIAAVNVRKLAAVLGIQYRQLENHDFNHTSVLILLDADGRIVARSEKLGAADSVFVAEVARILAQ